MKVFICLFAVLAITQARVNWLNVHPATLTPYPNGTPDVHQNAEDIERIVGGDKVIVRQRPFQAGLFVNMSGQAFFCGGSLISRNFVLTAAHCCENALAVEVVLGANDISNEDEMDQVRIKAVQSIVHGRWDSKSLINDICLLRLEKPVKLNPGITTAILPSRSDVGNTYTGELATVSGWGKDSDSATTISNVLRKTSNPVLSNEVCVETIPLEDLKIRNTHVCVSGKGQRGFCSGDGGGPLTIVRNGKDIQIGIVSFDAGLGCERGFPTVYTRVTKYLNWIAENSDVVIRP